MTALFQRTLDLNKKLSSDRLRRTAGSGGKAKSPHVRELIQRVIAATDRRIDELVYDLYGLTEKEVRIVEEGTAKSG